MLIDTHCHLYLEHFENDLDSVIQRARLNNVKKIILPNIDNESVSSMVRLHELYPDLFFLALGLHPTSVDKNYLLNIENIFVNNINIIGIGEIGIDLYWDKTFLSEQKSAFDYQINIALERQLPIIIHSRESFEEVLDIVKNYRDKKLVGVFHCFSGDYEQAKLAINLGFSLGIGGTLTYKNTQLFDVVSRIPIENLILETDSPYLSPIPFRGKRNEPSYVTFVAEKVALIKGLSLDEVCDKTTKNAQNLFYGIK